MMKKLKPASHHSVTDWDFLLSSDWSEWPRWELNQSAFVSPPSSLAISRWTATADVYSLSNLPLAQDVKAGAIITYARKAVPAASAAHIFFGVTTPGSTGIKILIPSPVTSWRKSRVTWWQGFDLHNDPATIVVIVEWDGSNWINEATQYHPPLSGAINRCGIGVVIPQAGGFTLFDDTEIWLPI